MADIAGGAVAFALGGLLVQGFDAAGAAMADFFTSALDAEKTQASLAALIHSVNSSAIDSATQLAAAQTTTTTTTTLSGDALATLQDKLVHATAKLDDMTAAYPKLKHPTETQTLALADQQKKVEALTASLAAGSAMITTTSGAMEALSNSGTFNIGVVNDLALKFRDLVGGSREAVLSIEAIGIRSGAISQDQMPKFIQTVADLAAVTGDASTAATLLARAQEDPIGALGKLQRAGILFSASLKEQIKDMVKHGDAAGATALIMERVATATGGQAAAAMDTLSGRWSILTEHLKTAGTELAMKMLPSLEKLFDQYIAPNIPVIERFASAIGDQLGSAIAFISGSFENFPGDIVGAIGDLLYKLAGSTNIGALNDLGDVINGLPADFANLQSAIAPVVSFVIASLPTVQQMIRDAFGWISLHQAEIKGAFIAIGAALVGAGIVAAVVGIGAAIASLLTPVGLIIAAAGLLGAAWAGNWGDIQGKTAAAWAVLQPMLAQLWTWLQVNVPLALAFLANYWQTVLLPAIIVVWTWVQTVLFPLLLDLWQWLQVTVPVALQTLATFWQTVLLPAITAVWTFLSTVWWPLMLELGTWLKTTLTAALQGLANFWTTVLLPAITKVWSWMNTTLFPFLNALWSFLTAVFQRDLVVFSAVWDGLLLPAITKVWKFFNESILPILAKVSDFLSVTFGPAIGTFGGIIQRLIDGELTSLKTAWDGINTAIGFVSGALNGLADIIRNLPPPPSWWKPGSPTPFELGLRGIGAAALELSQVQLPQLTQKVQLLPAPAMTGGGGGQVTNHGDTYNVTYYGAAADERSLSQDLSLFTRLRNST